MVINHPDADKFTRLIANRFDLILRNLLTLTNLFEGREGLSDPAHVSHSEQAWSLPYLYACSSSSTRVTRHCALDFSAKFMTSALTCEARLASLRKRDFNIFA